ncbi:MAG: magnesium transporter [Candidatus Omnitrophota bacterium]
MKKSTAWIAPEIKEIMALDDRAEKIREAFSESHPHDIFLLCEGLEPRDNAEIVMALGRPLGIEFFQEFEIKTQRQIFRFFPKEWMARVLEEMAPDERVDFIKALPRERTEEILPLVAQAERNDIRRLIQYKEGTAGSILTTEYASLSPDLTVKQAIERLKLQAFNRETIYYTYVVDADRKLIGFISLKDLIISESSRYIRDVMHTNVISVNLEEDEEIVAQKLSDYDLIAIPVVDDRNILMGIVTYDDVMDIIVQEDTEDIYKYGAAGEYIDYMGSKPSTIARKRIVWLMVLVVMGFVSGWVIESYAFKLEAVVALAFFIPLLCASAGNVGTQSSTVVIRGMATGEIEMKDVFRVVRKESSVGIMMGVGMGILAAARSVPMDRSLRLAATVSVAMVVAVLAAATLGGILPMLFKKLKLDPALMSGPFITSIVDIISLLVYLQIAVMVFK